MMKNYEIKLSLITFSAMRLSVYHYTRAHMDDETL